MDKNDRGTSKSLDEDGNIQCAEQFLEEIEKDKQQGAAAHPNETNTWEKILEKLVENTQANEQKSLKNIAEKFVIVMKSLQAKILMLTNGLIFLKENVHVLR